ncbi:hypothetical protein EK904_014948 [Melospiza melodia maxima]|nr:hypothetical protein EK904_014948 [Melospiza melodia maxima]
MHVVAGLWLCLCLGCAWAAPLSPWCLSAQLRRPGDFVLGGLFPFGKDTLNLAARSEPTLLLCDRLFTDGLIWALAMRFAIEQINNSSWLLPGVTLGYDMCDTCFEPLVALQPSLLFLTRNGTRAIGVLCDYSEYQPRVIAVIGPHKSDLCLLTAKLFSSFLIPQVSYGASSETLSNTELYPSFYRTVPSDKNLVEAVVLLLNHFGWNWVATVASDDEYGRGAQVLFLSMAGTNSICIAFEGLIPTELAEPDATKQLENTIKLINSTKVNVIVLFAHSVPAQALLQHSLAMGLGKKVWLGSEAWLLSDIATSVPNIQSVGTVLGFVMRTGTVPGFQEFVAELFNSVAQEEFCQRSRELSGLEDTEVLDTHCRQCGNVTLGDIWPMLGVTPVQPVHVAVYSVAHALHRALGCTSKGCPKTPVRSWQLLHFMNTLPFEVNGQSFRFDQSHGTNTGYKLILWAWREGTVTYLPVGDYDQSLYVRTSQIQFHTPDKKALEITLVTEFPRCAPRLLRWVTHGRAWLVVAVSILTQVLLCWCHLHLGPDYLVADYESLPREVLLVCGTQSWAAFALLHGYNSCLAFVCFLCTFMVQTPGRRYNVARGITFASFIYFIIWIFFLVIFATLRTVLRAVTQICTILATTLGILASYFVPKCYILVFRPDLNTRDYFQNLSDEQPEEDRQ